MCRGAAATAASLQGCHWFPVYVCLLLTVFCLSHYFVDASRLAPTLAGNAMKSIKDDDDAKADKDAKADMAADLKELATQLPVVADVMSQASELGDAVISSVLEVASQVPMFGTAIAVLAQLKEMKGQVTLASPRSSRPSSHGTSGRSRSAHLRCHVWAHKATCARRRLRRTRKRLTKCRLGPAPSSTRSSTRRRC